MYFTPNRGDYNYLPFSEPSKLPISRFREKSRQISGIWSEQALALLFLQPAIPKNRQVHYINYLQTGTVL